MSLISCSGTIGKMAYVRPEMEGMWSSQDVLKVVPDPNKIPPGYLYAFLSSKFGISLIASGTYGAIIQHLEPEHIADIPVPRLDSKTEWVIHDLVEKAAELRTHGNQELAVIKRRFNLLVDGIEKRHGGFWANRIPSVSLARRMDAGFYDPEAAAVRRIITEKRHTLISEFCSEIFLPGIFKRVPTDDPAYGVPYYTGNSLFEIEPLPKGYLSRRTAIDEGVIIYHNKVLVQAFGSEGGLNGRPVWVGNHLDGAATTHMLIRLKPKDPSMNGYLFAFLASNAGYTQMAALPYGGAIPHFDERNIGSVVIPLIDEPEMRSLSKEVERIQKGRDEALSLERNAREVVEESIEEAG
ncbi:MAG: hypothetical protein A2156_08515 [Deltaproteobacteria bacterium RBG_16_48_10]|nr:MAG: hypothetical protein A2156_08515 [Deltaproteobacteria bacterium RBG_16_48_10]